MKLGFNTTGNNQTSNRTTQAVCLGNLRNTMASTTRKFKFCNRNSPDLNMTFKCVFNTNKSYDFNGLTMQTFHIVQDLEYEENTDVLFQPDITTKAIIPFSPAQIKKAYSIDTIQPLNGARKPIITIISAYCCPNLLTDVTKFGNYFGLPSCNMKIFNFSKQNAQNWATETTLDVQWAYSINPYAEIRVILAASNKFSDIFSAINFANNRNNFSPQIDTDIMSMSFGILDTGGLSTLNSYFSNTKTIYVASSGDSKKTSFPSSSTNVLSIGGTSLYVNNDNTRRNETAWSSAGCGYSLSFSKPSYQPTISTNNLRITPDVSCVADPKTPGYAVINGRLSSVGGTSLSAPIYAGMLSLITQNRLNNNQTLFTSVQNQSNTIQTLLYNNQNKFFDVVSGSITTYRAQQGFDIASGLGVFNLNNIVNILS